MSQTSNMRWSGRTVNTLPVVTLRRAAQLWRYTAMNRLLTHRLVPWSLGLFALILACGIALAATPLEREYRVGLPAISLMPGELIDEVSINIDCAQFSAVTIIRDWYASTTRIDSSYSQTILLEGGNGATWLRSLASLDGKVRIRTDDPLPTCFRITAQVHLSGSNDRTVEIAMDKIRLSR